MTRRAGVDKANLCAYKVDRADLCVHTSTSALEFRVGKPLREGRQMVEHTDDVSHPETIFTMEATPLKFGRGSSEEVGWEAKQLRMSRVMLVSDPGVIEAGITPRIQELIEAEGIEVELFEKSRVEPTADSFQEAADFAKDGGSTGTWRSEAGRASTRLRSRT